MDLASQHAVGVAKRLPAEFTLPNGDRVGFDKVGQVAPSSDNPLYQIMYVEDAPAPEPLPSVPQVVSPLQARLALMRMGLREQVETAVALASEDVRVSWEYATEIRRQSPLITALAPALGLTDVALDQLFTLAATL